MTTDRKGRAARVEAREKERKLANMRALDLATELIAKQPPTPETKAAMESLYQMAVEIVAPNRLLAYAKALALTKEFLCDELADISGTDAADEYRKSQLRIAIKELFRALDTVHGVTIARQAGFETAYHPLRIGAPIGGWPDPYPEGQFFG